MSLYFSLRFISALSRTPLLSVLLSLSCNKWPVAKIKSTEKLLDSGNTRK